MLPIFVVLIGLVASPVASANCWRLPSGQIVSTAANSTPPAKGAVAVACPAPQITTRSQPAADPCQPYYGKGYCTDYVAQALGRRPTGDPRTWPVSTNLSSIHARVAVVFANVTSAGHVAVVDAVRRDAQGRTVLDLSEMNYGQGIKAGTPASCLVTPNFGRVTRRTVALNGSGITGFWGP